MKSMTVETVVQDLKNEIKLCKTKPKVIEVSPDLWAMVNEATGHDLINSELENFEGIPILVNGTLEGDMHTLHGAHNQRISEEV